MFFIFYRVVCTNFEHILDGVVLLITNNSEKTLSWLYMENLNCRFCRIMTIMLHKNRRNTPIKMKTDKYDIFLETASCKSVKTKSTEIYVKQCWSVLYSFQQKYVLLLVVFTFELNKNFPETHDFKSFRLYFAFAFAFNQIWHTTIFVAFSH